MFLGYLKKHSNDRNCMDISSFWFINAKGLSLSHKIFRVAIMPKTSDGIDNILIYLQDENGYIMAEMSADDESDMIVTMTEASPVQNFEFHLLLFE